ncbi:hypothetical protein KC909_06340, partial [Candidatus Dojkabacteria bacterium]|nr:hypothetical protein [Candidatus Dojkabacteria bacterium]
TKLLDIVQTPEVPRNISLEIASIDPTVAERFQAFKKDPVYSAILEVLTAQDESEQPRYGDIFLTGSFVHHFLREDLYRRMTTNSSSGSTIDRSISSDADFLADTSYESERGQEMAARLLQLSEQNPDLQVYVDSQKYINKVVIEEKGRRVAEVVFLADAADKARIVRNRLASAYSEEQGLIDQTNNLTAHLSAQTIVQEAQALEISKVDDEVALTSWRYLPTAAYPRNQLQARGFGLEQNAQENAVSPIRIANELSIYTPDRISKQIEAAQTYDELNELLSMNLYTRLDVFRTLAKDAELPQYFPYGYDWNALDVQDMTDQIIVRAEQLGINLEMLSQQIIAKEADFQKKAMRYWLRTMMHKPVPLIKETVRYNLLTDLLPNDSTHFQELLGWNNRAFQEQASSFNHIRSSDCHLVASGRIGLVIENLIENGTLGSSSDIFAVMIAGLGEYREEMIQTMAEEIAQFWPQGRHHIEGWRINNPQFDSRVNTADIVEKALEISRAINPIYPDNAILYDGMDFGASLDLWREQLLADAGISNESENPELYAQIHILLQKLLLTNSSVINFRVIDKITSQFDQINEEPS